MTELVDRLRASPRMLREAADCIDALEAEVTDLVDIITALEVENAALRGRIDRAIEILDSADPIKRMAMLNVLDALAALRGREE